MGKTIAYTGRGDDGRTSLYGGERVPKDDKRVEVLGELDELNSVLGIAISSLGAKERTIAGLLRRIQLDLFIIGAEVAAGEGVKPARTTTKHRLKKLERLIDEYNSRLPTLRQFILPGGSVTCAYLHLARAVCRRAERRVVGLSREQALNPLIIAYINRLSSLLFVLARYVNLLQGGREFKVPRSALGRRP